MVKESTVCPRRSESFLCPGAADQRSTRLRRPAARRQHRGPAEDAAQNYPGVAGRDPVGATASTSRCTPARRRGGPIVCRRLDQRRAKGRVRCSTTGWRFRRRRIDLESPPRGGVDVHATTRPGSTIRSLVEPRPSEDDRVDREIAFVTGLCVGRRGLATRPGISTRGATLAAACAARQCSIARMRSPRHGRSRTSAAGDERPGGNETAPVAGGVAVRVVATVPTPAGLFASISGSPPWRGTACG